MATWDWRTWDHWGFAGIALIGTFLASALLIAWLRDPRRGAWLRSFAGVAPPFINIVGVLFALTLAFLGNDTWNAHDRAVDAVTREADGLHSVEALAHGLDAPRREALDAAVRAYATSATRTEWPLLAARRSSPETAAALDRLLSLVADRDLGERLGPAVHARMLEEVVSVRDARDRRLSLSQTHVNPLKWLGMAFLGFVTMLSVALVHVENVRAAFAAIALFAAASAPTAAIVLMQGNPFQQPTTVTSAPLAALAEGR
ncbi:MAG: DUF4239 domain-containing protein [Hyphomicrobiales bacterium]|nr:DUF4239 domain-containing protein [Hyphomicrobiales bacterium]